MTGVLGRVAERMKQTPLAIVTGPTAAGKTGLSIRLAKKIGGEIISADSMQVYRHMDIGTAKIMPAQMEGVPHHMLDILEPTQEFNVAIFQAHAKRCIREIRERGHIPILTGGTGFYIQAVLYDIDFMENKEDNAYRQQLCQEAEKYGSGWLFAKLQAVDEKAAAQIHPNNIKRVIRALEFYGQTGTCISRHNETQRTRDGAYQSCYFVLTRERGALYQQIDRRVDEMMAAGLVKEVEALLRMGCKRESTAMQGLGYKEIIAYLQGETTLEDAICLIKRNTRHFAKRQLTWFRRERETIWIDKDSFANDEDAILDFMIAQLKEKDICF